MRLASGCRQLNAGAVPEMARLSCRETVLEAGGSASTPVGGVNPRGPRCIQFSGRKSHSDHTLWRATMSHPIDVSDATFEEEVLKSDSPVLVDFWAAWCAPCKMIAPIVDQLAREFAGTVKFAKLDVDNNPKVATDFGVRGIPTLLIFKGGQPVDQVVGVVPKSVLKRRIEEAMAKTA